VKLLTHFSVVPGAEGFLRENGMDSLDALFNTPNAEKLSKPGLSAWRERLRLDLMVGGVPRPFYLKRFLGPPLSARREVRRSGSGAHSLAGVEWEWMHHLAADGIPCVKPVAFGEELRGRREVRSAILTECVSGESLERLAAQWSVRDRPTIRRMIPLLAALVARLHGRGYIHRDLYLSHVFYDSTSPPEASLHMIDLQRVARPRWRRRRWMVKDLAALNYSAPCSVISTADRVRWLTHYLDLSKLNAPARRLVRLIVGKTRRIAEHDRRRMARWRKGSGHP